MAALVALRNQAIKPLLAAAQELRPSRGAHNPSALDTHYDTIRTAMRGVFQELRLAAGSSTIIFSGFALKGLIPSDRVLRRSQVALNHVLLYFVDHQLIRLARLSYIKLDRLVDIPVPFLGHLVV